MPSYKTHGVHGEIVHDQMNHIIDTSKEDIKSFCMGPDALIATDYDLFNYQHKNKTRDFFQAMLKYIKDNHLEGNPEVMAFLYGQIDHFVLDATTHPLIFYMTEGLPVEHKVKPHGLVEMWIDDYVSKEYNKNDLFYYKKRFIKDKQTKEMIDNLYRDIFYRGKESTKYSMGMCLNTIFDWLVRQNKTIKPILKLANTGDVLYSENIDRVLPYLNLDNEMWFDPETGVIRFESFDDLWDKATEVSLETIEDANNFIYKDIPTTNPFLNDNLTYDTGFPCEQGQTLQYIKKYK